MGYEEELEPLPEDRRCQDCGGVGVVGRVSRDMAIDAGEPSLEGQLIECHYCGGRGEL